MAYIKINVTKATIVDQTNQTKREYLMGSIPIHQIEEFLKVDRYAPDTNPGGYQRKRDNAHMKKLIGHFSYNSSLFTVPINLGHRETNTIFTPDPEINELEHPTDVPGKLELHMKVDGFKDDYIWIIDGQHRMYAMIDAYKANPVKYKDFSCPFILHLGSDQEYERNTFNAANSQKSIETGLKAHNAALQSSENVKFTLSDDRKRTTTKVANIVLEDEIWSDVLARPNQTSQGTLIRYAAFLQALRPLQSQDSLTTLAPSTGNEQYDSDQNIAKLAALLKTYWKGIQLCMPEAFNKALDYAVQSSQGVALLMSAYPTLYSGMKEADKNPESAASVAEIIRVPLLSISGENKDRKRVTGLNYWEKSPYGGVKRMTREDQMETQEWFKNAIRSSIPRVQ
jgi:DGQHR domain-containing protein